jgi:hypothetical protein
MGPQHFTLAHNILVMHEGTFLLDQGGYDLSTKPTGACLSCDHECLAPCWMLLLVETPY